MTRSGCLLYVCVLRLAAAAAADEAVCLEECVYSDYAESENDHSYEEVADVCESLFPDVVAETHCLECAPETVAEVKAEGYEPHDVEGYHPPVLECLVEEEIWVLCVMSLELLELHVCPEVVEVECHESENYDSEEKHVLRCPRLSLALAAAFITLYAAACLDIARCEDESVDDVEEETCCEYRNHDGYDRKCHEVTTCLEETLCCSVSSLACVNHREEIDRHMQKEEHNEEKAAYTHDKLLGN